MVWVIFFACLLLYQPQRQPGIGVGRVDFHGFLQRFHRFGDITLLTVDRPHHGVGLVLRGVRFQHLGVLTHGFRIFALFKEAVCFLHQLCYLILCHTYCPALLFVCLLPYFVIDA